MNESDMPESQPIPVTETTLYKALEASDALDKARQAAWEAERREEDDNLAAAAIRDSYAKAWRAAAQRIGLALGAVALLGILLVQHVSEQAGALLILFGPMAVVLGAWFLAVILQTHAGQALAKLPLWDRHCITLVLRRVAGKDVP